MSLWDKWDKSRSFLQATLTSLTASIAVLRPMAPYGLAGALIAGVYIWDWQAQPSLRPLPDVVAPFQYTTCLSVDDFLSSQPTLPKSVIEKRFVLPSKTSLAQLLLRLRLNKTQVKAALQALGKKCMLSQLHPGQSLTLTYEEKPQEKCLYSLSLMVNLKQFNVVRKKDGQYVCEQTILPLQPVFTRIQGVVCKNLMHDMMKQGVSARMAQSIIRTLTSTGINWRLNLRPGDYFSFFCKESRHPKTGQLFFDGVLFVRLQFRNGQHYTAYRYQPSGSSKPFFYSAQGICHHKEFLQRPIEGAKLSDRFGMRYHPVFCCRKMHTGIDLKAPRGTPVKAACEGIVVKKEWYGGYGKYILIRHHKGYYTAYAHLSGYVTTLRPGSVVKRGQVIGFVGATGTATGPHLHFEVLHQGQHLDPLAVKAFPGHQLVGHQWVKFKHHVKQLTSLYDKTPRFFKTSRRRISS